MNQDMMKSLYKLLNDAEIQYCVLTCEEDLKNTELLVHPDFLGKLESVFQSNGCSYEGTSTKEYSFIYGLKPDKFYRTPWGATVHVACQMSCTSLSNLSKCKLPLDEYIQKSVWQNKYFDSENACWRISCEDFVVYKITDCVFNKGKFETRDIEEIYDIFNKTNLTALIAELETVFFRFTPDLIDLIKNKEFNRIKSKYRTFKDY